MIVQEHLLNQAMGNIEPIVGLVFRFFCFVIHFVFLDHKILIHFAISFSELFDNLLYVKVLMLLFPNGFKGYRSSLITVLQVQTTTDIRGILERASGALFNFPFLYSTIKSKHCNLSDHLLKRLVVFVDERTHFKAEWSVMTVNNLGSR